MEAERGDSVFPYNNNPMDMIKQMAQQNPNYAPIVQMLESGKKPEEVFREMCKERGINADFFISFLNKR